MRASASCFIELVVLMWGATALAQDYFPADHVAVLPVFFVPDGEAVPTADQQDRLMQHLSWSRQRFNDMLDCRGTFDLAPASPLVFSGDHTLPYYRQLPENAAPQYISELLAHHQMNRFNSPHIYVIIVMNPYDNWPAGGGRPCNGGFNTGGGLVIMSSYGLDGVPNFQSTLQHELGHSFGLPHVDVYGYDMQTSPSIMSYNPDHHTNGFEPSPRPGILIPEDVRGLAYNDRVFGRLAFDPQLDLPHDYAMAAPVWLGPMTIPGQVDNVVAAATGSGEAYGSSIDNVVQGQIKPSAGPGITFDPASMWHSDYLETGWASIELIFPLAVTLDCVGIHSQHSGLYHAAERAQIMAWVDGSWLLVADSPLDDVDAELPFDPAEAQQWRLRLESGPSHMVVVRGLQFYDAGVELFPPFIPEPVTDACRWDLDGDHDVGPADLAAVLGAWGIAEDSPADLDCDGIVGPADLALILGNWQSCINPQ